ncbi:MAG: response regulator [Tepidisphaeraceae bacterium]|jgi:DNA-binding response OmpR family regulator
MHWPTILVVDDEASIRTSVRLCLESAGYVVQQANNGRAALDQLVRDPPDLMLLDLLMPFMDGKKVLAEMRGSWARYPTPVVVITAIGSVKTAIEAMLLGASDFLEKPFTPEDLRLSVAGVLREEPVDRGSCGQGYTGALANARQALRERRFRDAERELMKAGTIAGDDPAFLNLAGEWHEARGRIASAKRFFARAVAKDCTYRPARENLVRLGEFYAGATSRPAQVVPMGRRLSAL